MEFDDPKQCDDTTKENLYAIYQDGKENYDYNCMQMYILLY